MNNNEGNLAKVFFHQNKHKVSFGKDADAVLFISELSIALS